MTITVGKVITKGNFSKNKNCFNGMSDDTFIAKFKAWLKRVFK